MAIEILAASADDAQRLVAGGSGAYTIAPGADKVAHSKRISFTAAVPASPEHRSERYARTRASRPRAIPASPAARPNAVDTPHSLLRARRHSAGTGMRLGNRTRRQCQTGRKDNRRLDRSAAGPRAKSR